MQTTHRPTASIRYGWRARLGMILPSGNVAAEPQFSALLPEGVSLHTTRLKLTGSSDAELVAMADGAEGAASLLADACADLILFHCTALTMWDAEMDASLPKRITAATGIRSTTTARGVMSAFRALDIRKIVLVSPYIEAINTRETAFLEGRQIKVLSATGLGISEAKDMGTVEPGEWYRLVRSKATPEADAYFVSCTAIRSLEAVETLERDLCKPVITSNQAAIWHSLRELGIEDRIEGCGRLLSAH